jgi:copper chaperone
MNAEIVVENLKCNGCANTIRKELTGMEGVSSVEVDKDAALIRVSYVETLPLDTIKQKLSHLGYPEVDTLHGLNKMAANAKSYVSCAVGRLS